MIDLHIHTTYSDGEDTVIEILKKAKENKLEVISITDHNSCLSYIEMEKFNIEDYYKGKIIVGCEFTTSFDKRGIEILGYNLDYKLIQEKMNKLYTYENINKRTITLYNRLIDKIHNLGFKTSLNFVDDNFDFMGKYYDHIIFKDLLSFDENIKLLKENKWNTIDDFFRNGLANPTSKIFINPSEFNPTLKETIDLIHEAGGITFLAHPYQYRFNNTLLFLEKIFSEYDLDGIECFYSTFTKEEIKNIIDFAKKRNLLISGGSDYHGKIKKNKLGIGLGNLCVNYNIIKNWNVDFYKKNKKDY